MAAQILLIDDSILATANLSELLHKQGYRVLGATNAKQAFEILEHAQPDLILLDVMLPDMNGFEVCRRLKETPGLADIPVIFMTALNDTKSKIAGFDAGGVDYITKPFHNQEVLVRIRTRLSLAGHRLALNQKNKELQAFARTVAHDLKSPLHTIMSYLDIIGMACEDNDMAEVKAVLPDALRQASKTGEIVDALLLLATASHSENSIPIEAFDMGFVVPRVQERLALILDKAKAALITPSDWPFVSGYPPWVEEIWVNYICNAVKYGGSPPRIEIGYDEYEDSVRFWVRDNGQGLSAEQKKQLFIPFSRLHKERKDSHGLGLAIVRSIIDKLNGSIGVESEVGQGCLFYFILPRQPAPQHEAEDPEYLYHHP
jgi:signal transduction histidine kinase